MERTCLLWGCHSQWAGEAVQLSLQLSTHFLCKRKKPCLEIAKVRGVWAWSCSDPDTGRTGLCPDTSPKVIGTDGSRQIVMRFLCV